MSIDFSFEEWNPFLIQNCCPEDKRKYLLQMFWTVSKKSPNQMKELLYEWNITCELYPDENNRVELLKNQQLGWNHPEFKLIREQFLETDRFLQSPPDIDEGIIECKRCHSKRTFSFSKQTRRSDESATVFVQCATCRFSFRL